MRATDDTARHFFSSESAGIPARHMKLIPEIRHRQRFIYKTKRRKGSRTVIIGGKRHREQHRIPGKFGLGLH
ncbi:hypothetical protein SRHO_G00236010 [Serrasalmus rhombeus]